MSDSTALAAIGQQEEDILPTLSHHPFGPSKWGLYDLCPPSYHEARRAPFPSATAGTERGERFHRAIETGEVTGLDDYTTDAVHRCWEWWDARVQEIVEKTGKPVRCEKTEERVVIRGIEGRVISFGRVDKLAIIGQGALVVDWKSHPTGAVPEAFTAPQLTGYAVGVLQSHPDVHGVYAAAYAPHGPTEYHITLRRDDLARALSWIERLWRRIHEDREYRPGSTQCPRCVARFYCTHAIKHSERFWEKVVPGCRIDGDDIQVTDHFELANAWDVAKQLKAAAEARLESIRTILAAVGDEGSLLELRWSSPQRKIPRDDLEKAWDLLPPAVREALRGKSHPPIRLSALEKVIREVEGLKAREARKRADELLGEVLRLEHRAPSVQVRDGVTLSGPLPPPKTHQKGGSA